MGKIALIVYSNSRGLDKPAHPRSLARIYAFHSRKWQAKGKLHPKDQTCGLAETK